MGNALCLSGTIKGEVLFDNAYLLVKDNIRKSVKEQRRIIIAKIADKILFILNLRFS